MSAIVSNEWARGPLARAVRRVLQRLVLLPVTSCVCRPARVTGREHLRGPGPFVFVANHSSHADTALLLKSLPPSLRRRTAPAAAEDYFFRSRVRGVLVSLLTGAFPFPRCGRGGLARAEALLARGWSVILFPEGTRSRDGEVHEFKRGASELAAAGATIVPVGIAGTCDVLGKGSKIPRRAPVAVSFGAALQSSGDVSASTEELRDRVVSLTAQASAALPRARTSWYERVRHFAASRSALRLCFLWGLAEALFFPIIPDFAVAPLALAAPESFVPLALTTAAGSLIGGALAYGLGATPLGVAAVEHLPLVTERMTATAHAWLSPGPRGLLRQPMSGIPYKVFAYQAQPVGNGFLSFIGFSALARGGRLLAVAMGFAGAGLGARRLWPRVYGAFLCAYVACFAIGLARAVHAWG